VPGGRQTEAPANQKYLATTIPAIAIIVADTPSQPTRNQTARVGRARGSADLISLADACA
jgi:hypothetical protein